MAWNEPGRGGGRGGWNGGGDGPDLDRMVRDINERFGRYFGGGFGMVAFILIALWLASGLYKVDAAEQGVVLRFGEFSEITDPGLHWHIPRPIERVEKVNVNEVMRRTYESEMLTADYNIVAIEISVQFRRSDPTAYLFNVRDPEPTLEEVLGSAVREVVGQRDAEYVLTTGRAEVVSETRTAIQAMLDQYGTGLIVTQVNLEEVRFPGPVLAAVQDVNSAEQDRQRKIQEAQAYFNDIVPNARGQAARQLAEADAYRQQRINDATGEVARFLALLEQYQAAPEVTRQRLYLETLELVYGGARKVIIEGDGNTLLLPIGMGGADAARYGVPAAVTMDADPGSDAARSRAGLRDRGRP